MNTPTMQRVWVKVGIAFVTLAVGTLGSLTSTPAQAGDWHYHHRATLASCIGNESANWSPGLTNTVQPYKITVDNQWSNCTIDNQPSSVTASSQATFSVTESCSKLGVPAQATWIIKWSNGWSSTFQFDASVNISGGNFMITAPGLITDGAYRGKEAIATFTLLNVAGLLTSGCDTPQGVSTINGPSGFVVIDD